MLLAGLKIGLSFSTKNNKKEWIVSQDNSQAPLKERDEEVKEGSLHLLMSSCISVWDR